MIPFTSNLIVGIAGKAGHGKDSVAKIISKQLKESGQCSNIFHFADALKDAYAMMFSLDREKLDELEFKLQRNAITGTTHREELQFLGTEAYRTRCGNPDVWVEVLAERLKIYMQESIVPTLVPDVRFENEARFCVQNGLLIRVVRPGQEETINAGHVSEAGFATEPHMTLINGGSMADLEESCQSVTEMVLLKYRTYQQVIRDAKLMTFL